MYLFRLYLVALYKAGSPAGTRTLENVKRNGTVRKHRRRPIRTDSSICPSPHLLKAFSPASSSSSSSPFSSPSSSSPSSLDVVQDSTHSPCTGGPCF